MLCVKRKLSSKAGASMLLAMVFLMFCMFIGGSVLAAATANGSRVEHLKNDQQDYLSQRSAMLLMADMLTGQDGKELQVTITDSKVTSATDTIHNVTFSAANLGTTTNSLQELLFYTIITQEYPDRDDIDKIMCSKLNLSVIPSSNYSTIGTITITDPAGNKLTARYKFTADYTLNMAIYYGEDETKPVEPLFTLSMNGSLNRSKPREVQIGDITTTTQTTVISWGIPVVEKGDVKGSEYVKTNGGTSKGEDYYKNP